MYDESQKKNLQNGRLIDFLEDDNLTLKLNKNFLSEEIEKICD
jgi:hypothetical protein